MHAFDSSSVVMHALDSFTIVIHALESLDIDMILRSFSHDSRVFYLHVCY